MYTQNELFFPHHLIRSLRNLRGQEWANLVERIIQLPETHEETLAFMLMMVRLNGCMVCETDSYRAMRGCKACAEQMLRRFKGDDAELLVMYNDALKTIREHAYSSPDIEIMTP